LTSRLRDTIGTQAPVTHRWAATVTYADPPLPIADAFDERVWGAGGYSGTGNVVGTLCGAGLARRALGVSDAFLDALDAAKAAVRRAATGPLVGVLLGLVGLLAGTADRAHAQGGAAPPAAAARPPTTRSPSPMADHTRAHERLVERPVAGSTGTITGPADREVALHIAPAVRDAYELVVHFHGAP
jgi:hypothetical protein